MDNTAIQNALIARGYKPGFADGKLGPRSEAAIKAFQADQGLNVDGRVGPATLLALFPVKAPARPADLPTYPPAPGAGPWPLQRDCMTFYGGVGLHQKMLDLPFSMKLAWDKSVTIRRISLHEKVHESADRAFARIAATYSEAERVKLGLDLYGGSLNVRKMRGGSSYSMHSWGIAIDFDPERNQLAWGKDKARLAQPDAVPFWRIWEDEGWVSLGRSKNMDWMHVQAARL